MLCPVDKLDNLHTLIKIRGTSSKVTLILLLLEFISKLLILFVAKNFTLLYNWKSGHNSVGQIGSKANEVDPGGSKVDPPSDPLSLSLERLLLILLGQPSSRPDGTARQVEGATVGKGGDKDGVHDEEEKGEDAGAKHGGH